MRFCSCSGVGTRTSGQRFGVAGHVTIQPLGQCPGVALVMVDVLVLLIQADRLHHDILHAQRDELAMQHETERTGFVATVHLMGLAELTLDPFDEIARRKLLRGLRRAVFEDAHDHDAVGMHVQTQLDEFDTSCSRLAPRELRSIRMLAFHYSLVGVALRRSPANYSCHLQDLAEFAWRHAHSSPAYLLSLASRSGGT